MSSSLPPVVAHPGGKSGGTDASSSPISSAASDASLYLDLQSRVEARLSQYQSGPNDTTVPFLRILLKYLPKGGQINLMKDILALNRNCRLRKLKEHFITAALIPCKAAGGKTPQPVESPRPQVREAVQSDEWQVEPSTRDDQKHLKEQCLERDGYRCVSSGLLDNTSFYDGLVQGDGQERTSVTKAAHILPFSLGHFDGDNGQQVHNKMVIWEALFRYFPHIDGKIGPASINSPKNVMTLCLDHDAEFGSFNLVFVATTNANEYHVEARPTLFIRPRDPVTLQADANTEAPDPDLLATHHAIAKILSVSGIGKKLDKYIYDRRFDDDIIKADGSSDLEGMIARRLMIV